MENYIFYRYKEWLKARDGSLLKQVSKLTIGAIILLSLLFVVLITMFVFILLSKVKSEYINIAYILMGVEGIIIIITSIYSERIQVIHSKKNFINYKAKCKEMEDFLTENSLPIEFVPFLIERFNDRISKIEEMIKHKHEVVNKFMEMLLIPVSALILGAMLDKEMPVTETLELGLLGFLIVFLIYAVIIFMLFLYDTIMRFPENKYKQFISDWQDFLDFKEYERIGKQVVLENATH